MSDKVFIDTNIFVYAFLDTPNRTEDALKHQKAQTFLGNFSDNEHVTISTQVCNEYYSALRKHHVPDKDIQHSLRSLMTVTQVEAVTDKTVQKAMEIRNRYGFSYWDSLIIASALENDCRILYSEDMQDGQEIKKRLKILNPFSL